MRGSQVWRFAALIAVSLAAVTTAAQASNKSALLVNVTPGLNAANFNIQTAMPSKVIVWEGTDTQNMQAWHSNTLISSRSFSLSPLAPNTKYFYKVTATSSNGTVSNASGQFSTTQWDSQPTLAVQSGKLYLNHVRFYPIMAQAFNECPSQRVVSDDNSLGVNVLYHSTWYSCPDENHNDTWLTADQLHALLGNQVGWIQAGSRVGINPTQPPSWDSLPELINLQGSLNVDRTLPYLSTCDPGFDSASGLYQKLSQETNPATVLYAELVSSIGDGSTCLTVTRMTALFWTPILAGASGIEYQTQLYALPSDGVVVNGSVGSAAGVQAKHLDTLYPCIFGGRAVTASSSNPDVKVQAWSWGGGTCVTALNLGGQAETATLKVGSSSQSAKVLWQSRSVTINKGIATDHFGAYGLNVYELQGN